MVGEIYQQLRVSAAPTKSLSLVPSTHKVTLAHLKLLFQKIKYPLSDLQRCIPSPSDSFPLSLFYPLSLLSYTHTH